jgi:hypothetical protein
MPKEQPFRLRKKSSADVEFRLIEILKIGEGGASRLIAAGVPGSECKRLWLLKKEPKQ